MSSSATDTLLQRIFEVLLSRGRTTAKRLGQDTSLSPRLVRHGLTVLVQQNLIWHHTDPDTLATHYEANAGAAYNVVRTGKILDTIHHNYGEEAKFLVHNILVNGHLKVSELMQLKSPHAPNGVSPANPETNGAASETSGTADDEPDHAQHTFDLIAHLIAVGMLEPLNMRSLQPPEDVRAELDREIMKDYPSGLRGTKQKNEFNARSKEAWREVQDESKDLKRRLERDYMNGPTTKRRKLANGASANGFSAVNRDDVIDVSCYGLSMGPDYRTNMLAARHYSSS